MTGLLALMLLTDARRGARAGPNGELIPMAEQNRSLWNAASINEGVELVTAALRRGKPGPYQIQAAIAAVHDEAPSFDTTDWPQIVVLYEVLLQGSRNPVLELNHAVAVGMTRGPRAGLQLIESSRLMEAWLPITECTRCGRICTRWRVTWRRQLTPMRQRQNVRRTWPSSGTSTSRPRV